MSNPSQPAADKAHEFVSGQRADDLCVAGKDATRLCMQPRSAPIHRLDRDAPAHPDTASLTNDDNPIVGGECCTEAEPASEPQDAPPELEACPWCKEVPILIDRITFMLDGHRFEIREVGD